MNIKLPFDYNKNIDDINIILKDNSLNNIGNISSFANLNLQLYFNNPNEISFDVYKSINGIENEYWSLIRDLAIIHIEELNENFKIYVSIDDNDNTIKHIIGNALCEDELSHIKLYDVQINTSADILREDYTTPTVFYNINPKISLLNRILEKAPHYKIGHIDERLMSLQYVFDFGDMSVYDALIEVSKKVNCVFKFDSNTRTISAYDLMNYCLDCKKRFDEHTTTCPHCNKQNIVQGLGNDTCITVSSDNIASIVSLDGNEENYINCLRVKTGDEYIDATIRNIMPNGSEYLYYFDKNLQSHMPKTLVDKLNAYNVENDKYINDYVFNFENVDLKNKYNTLVNKYNNDPYKVRDYDNKGEPIVVNNSFMVIDNTIKGFHKIANLLYDNVDFAYYLEHSLMPIVLDKVTTIDEDILNLNVTNLSPFSLSELNDKTTKSTVEIFLKKYCNLYLRNSYIVSFEESTYTYKGLDTEGWEYGNWVGKIRITTYGNKEETRITGILNLKVSNNYELFLSEKVKTTIRKQDDDVGGIYHILNITDDTLFKNALKQYSLVRLNSFYDAYKGGIDVMIEADQASVESDFYQPIYVPLYRKHGFIEEEIKVRTSEIELINKVQEDIEKVVSTIQNALNMETFMGVELWKLLKTYIREDVYTNDNITSEGLSNKEVIDIAKEVIDLARKNLKQIGYIQKTITCSLNNFLSIPEFETYYDEFELGNWIVTEIDDKLYYNRFISLGLSFTDSGLEASVELSQVTQSEDELSDTKNVLSQASSLAGSIGEIKSKVEQSNANTETINSWLKDGLDLTNLKIVSSASNQSVVYDKNGILIRSVDDVTGNFLPEQLKIVNSTIAITDDNWKSIKTAIGRFNYVDPLTKQQKMGYGVNGEVLIGSLLIGESLLIKTKDNSVTIDNNGITINTTSTTVNKELFTISKDGVKKLYIDAKGDIIGNDITINNLNAKNGYFSGSIDVTSGTIKGLTIEGNTIKGGTINGSTISGNTISGGTVSGSTISGGTISGTTISGTTIKGGTISGTNITGGTISSDASINVTTDLRVGYNIYLGNYNDRNTSRNIYFNDRFFVHSRNDMISFGIDNSNPFAGKVRVSSSGSVYMESEKGNVFCVSNTDVFIASTVGLSMLNGGNLSLYDGGNINFGGGTKIYEGLYNGSSNLYLYAEGYNAIYSFDKALYYSGEYVDAQWTAGKFYPGSSGVALGTSGNRWYRLYAANACSTSSDRRLKNDIMYFNEMPQVYNNSNDTIYESFFKKLKPSSFTMKDDTFKRIKFGFIAQDVIQSLNEVGLTIYDVDFVSHGRDENDKINDNEMLSLCYEEFISLNTHMIQKNIVRIESLEKENQKLKEEIGRLNSKLDAFINNNYIVKTNGI